MPRSAKLTGGASKGIKRRREEPGGAGRSKQCRTRQPPVRLGPPEGNEPPPVPAVPLDTHTQDSLKLLDFTWNSMDLEPEAAEAASPDHREDRQPEADEGQPEGPEADGLSTLSLSEMAKRGMVVVRGNLTCNPAGEAHREGFAAVVTEIERRGNVVGQI